MWLKNLRIIDSFFLQNCCFVSPTVWAGVKPEHLKLLPSAFFPFCSVFLLGFSTVYFLWRQMWFYFPFLKYRKEYKLHEGKGFVFIQCCVRTLWSYWHMKSICHICWINFFTFAFPSLGLGTFLCQCCEKPALDSGTVIRAPYGRKSQQWILMEKLQGS